MTGAAAAGAGAAGVTGAGGEAAATGVASAGAGTAAGGAAAGGGTGAGVCGAAATGAGGGAGGTTAAAAGGAAGSGAEARKGSSSIRTWVMPFRAIPMASPVSREISAIRSALIGIRPLTVASTDRLLLKFVTRTLVLKDKLGWDIKNPVLDALYEALPVWDWEKQKSGKNRPKIKITQ
jgi:hypothetical protein